MEHATRVRFPATRGKYVVAHGQIHRLSKSVCFQIWTPFRNPSPGVCGEPPQTARESRAPPGSCALLRRALRAIALTQKPAFNDGNKPLIIIRVCEHNCRRTPNLRDPETTRFSSHRNRRIGAQAERWHGFRFRHVSTRSEGHFVAGTSAGENKQ